MDRTVVERAAVAGDGGAAVWAPGRTGQWIVSSAGRALRYSAVRETFDELTTTIGLHTATERPNMHDLRHSLAVSFNRRCAFIG